MNDIDDREDLEGFISELSAPDEDPVFGPYDLADAPDDELARVDLGSLHVPVLPGVEIRLPTDESGEPTAVELVHRNGSMQLGAYAAPRTDSIWDELRADIRYALEEQGAQVEDAEGEYGAELRVRMPDEGGYADLRILGIEGPRWLVRAVFRGRAAVDERAAAPLADALYGLLVDRGSEAMPIREALPIKLPAG